MAIKTWHMTQLTFSSNFYWKICFKFCILEQIIATVLFICISSINNKRSLLRFQSTMAPTNRGWSACGVRFWRLQWHISSQTSIECSPPPPRSVFANLSPAVASTCCSSLAGVSCGNPMDNPTCLQRTLLNSPRWLNTVTGDEPGLTFQLISTPSLPTQSMKNCTTPLGSMPPTLYIPQETEQWKICETRLMVFCPYPRRLEYLTICRLQNKGS